MIILSEACFDGIGQDALLVLDGKLVLILLVVSGDTAIACNDMEKVGMGADFRGVVSISETDALRRDCLSMHEYQKIISSFTIMSISI